ncbi:hypothetical protein D1AOALGA4SA_10080 [Olavius algarvensis Delta 1 endosymbiont]|nr:hypothetical protein D1AOALGA4SA_10080 [Olavius algarvensis Delta 1 endosymbiont]
MPLAVITRQFIVDVNSYPNISEVSGVRCQVSALPPANNGRSNQNRNFEKPNK